MTKAALEKIRSSLVDASNAIEEVTDPETPALVEEQLSLMSFRIDGLLSSCKQLEEMGWPETKEEQ